MTKDLDLTIKTVIVWDSILWCEDRVGKIIPFEELSKRVLEESKKNKIKINKLETKKILKYLLIGGLIFYPRKSFVQRI